MIPVTKPYLPPKEEYINLIDGIWERNWLTNNGPLVRELENALIGRDELQHLLYLTNGTIALQLAIKALQLTDEIITTPFSYVATTSSIVWEGCTPVFVDIDQETFNIDANKIEAAITKKTTAILATHVFGNPCELEKINAVAKKHNLKIIYDAAHCFGVKYKGKSIFSFGDVSTVSYHATKIFHTIEGGAIITNNRELNYRLSKMRNFGHNGEAIFDGIGINGKNSEFHAAMGLVNLKHIDSILNKRKQQYLYYKEQLNHSDLIFQRIINGTDYNHSYFPIVFKSEKLLLITIKELEKNNIYARRYFYPSLSKLAYVQSDATPISDNISKRILCLPIYHQLTHQEQDLICKIILSTQNN